MGALVEIADVSLADSASSELQAAFLDAPRSGTLIDAQAVDVLGWALGAHRRALAAEFAIDGSLLRRAPLRAERPDLASAFPGRAEAGRAGFRTTLDLIGTPAEFELQISIVLEGRRRTPLASIRGRQRWRREHSPAFARLVSVVIPYHGGVERLGEGIESALAQTYPHVEVVIIDGGSIGDASAIASRHPGVRCISEPSSSGADARNAGIRASNGDFLVFLDPQDTLAGHAVQAGMEALEERPECAAALAAPARGPCSAELPRTAGASAPADDYARLLREGWAGPPAFAIYRRSLLEHVRGFDPAVAAATQLAFDLRVAREFPICWLEARAHDQREQAPQAVVDRARALSATIETMRRQRPHVRGTPDLRRALRDGKRRCKRRWGDLLIGQTRASLRDRRFADALRQAAVLARRRPGALPRLLRPDHSRSG
jgi:hypothetical protein